MKLKERAKIDNIAMRIIKSSEIRYVIAHTNKGDLSLMLPFEGKETDYKFVLDAVPLDEEQNRKLLDLYDGVLFEI